MNYGLGLVRPVEYAERRRHERVSVDINVRWGWSLDCVLSARVISLSVGGCFLRTPEAADTGRVLYIDLSLPARVLAGEVRYRIKDFGLGVEFKEVDPLTAMMLHQMVEFYKNAAPAE